MKNNEQDLAIRIEVFRKRIVEDRDYCLELFEHASLRLMAHKYAYYVLARPILSGKNSDVAYDIEERSWYVMGRALEILKDGEHSPCIDFDHRHPLAVKGIELATRLLK